MLSNGRYVTISMLFILAFVVFVAFNPGIYDLRIELRSDVSFRLDGGAALPEDGAVPDVTEHPTAAEYDWGERYAVIASDLDGAAAKNVLFTLDCLGRPYTVYSSMSDFADSGYHADLLVVATGSVNGGDAARYADYLREHDVVFTVLPNFDADLYAALGILSADSGYTIEGFDIYSEVLTGGMFRAEDWRMSCVKIKLDGRCKVLANGHNPDRDKTALVIDREDENPLIWRITSADGGSAYVFNGEFMSLDSAPGLLAGVISERGGYIYPIIGTRTVALNGFPYVGTPDATRAGRPLFTFQRDIIYPDLISIARENLLVYTAFTNGNYQINDKADETVSFFAGNLNKSLKSETGYIASTSDEHFAYDTAQLSELLSGSTPRSYYLSAGMSDDFLRRVNTGDMTAALVRRGDDSAYTWITDRAVALPVVSVEIDDERENLSFVSGVSLPGITMHLVDMTPPIVGSRLLDDWNYYAISMTQHFSYLFKHGKFLTPATFSDAAETAKNFLSTSYSFGYSDSGVAVYVQNSSAELSFILTSRHEIERTENCTVSAIEEGRYLVTSDSSFFEVVWKEDAR